MLSYESFDIIGGLYGLQSILHYKKKHKTIKERPYITHIYIYIYIYIYT